MPRLKRVSQHNLARASTSAAQRAYGTKKWKTSAYAHGGTWKSKGEMYAPAVPIMNARTAGFLGIETKFIDYTYSDNIPAAIAGAEADTPGVGAQTAPGSISAIAQGDSESNRDGRKCTLVGLNLKGQIVRSAQATVGTGISVRVCVVWDTQTNGVQLNSEDVFKNPTEKVLAFRNLQFSKRFRVLKDQTFDMNVPASAGNGTAQEAAASVRTFKWNFPLAIDVIHKGTTAVVANITDNSLHILAWASATGCILKYESRIRFRG